MENKNRLIKIIICVCLLTLGLASIILDVVFIKELPKILSYIIVIIASLFILISMLFFYSISKYSIKVIICMCLLALGLASIIIDIVFIKELAKVFSYIIVIIASLFMLIGLLLFYSISRYSSKKLSIKQMSMIGIQSAITVILYYFVKFNVPFFPPWLDIQVSEIPALITGFAYGPYAGCLVILVRFILKLPATITAGVGEAADLLLGVSLVLISSLIYKKHRNIKGALVGTALGVVFATILACVLNWLILIPAYIFIAGYPQDRLILLLSYMPFEVSESNFMLSYIFVGVLPFNLFRYILVFGLTFLLYKKIHILIDRITK